MRCTTLASRSKRGERVAVIGPNGAGKSTLFKAIVGVKHISSGRITIYGEDTHSSHTNVGYVPQQSAIDWSFPASVFDVVMMGRCRHIGWFRWPSKDDRAIVRDILEHLSLDQLADRQISELSGGQRQRVFIARALAQDTRLMVLDEPFTGVDQTAEQEIIESLDILTNHGITLLLSTHHMENAALHFDKILILRQRLLAYGPPDDDADDRQSAGSFRQRLAGHDARATTCSCSAWITMARRRAMDPISFLVRAARLRFHPARHAGAGPGRRHQRGGRLFRGRARDVIFRRCLGALDSARRRHLVYR